MAVWGGLTNSCQKKRSEKQRRKGRIYPSECSLKEQQGEKRKPSSVINAKKQRKTIDWEKLEISSRKLDAKGRPCKDGLDKGQKGRDLTEAEDIKKRWQEYTEELYRKDLHDPKITMV